MNLIGKHILIGISGGIAAYKIPELIRLFTKAGAEVRVTTTRHALEFVTEMTLQTLSGHSVYSDVFAAINAHATEHISLPEWADVMLVAPATANVLGKTAAGIADDALTTTICSCAARRPVVIAPAMNDKMWENPATQKAIATLRTWERVTVLEPAEGPLACGTSGKGRMPEADVLFEAVQDVLTPKTMTGRHVLITAGPTQEKIDPVRYLSNYSTGKMGFALARECARRGADVTIVCGPTAEHIHDIAGRVHRIDVQTAHEMYNAATSAWRLADTAILCAAVADFTPEEETSEKIKKQPGQQQMTLRLRTTPDIAAALGASKQKGQRLIGFALETQNEEANAMHKLTSKHMDAIVLNSLRDEGAGFGTDTNRVTILTSDGRHTALPLESKADVARDILDTLI
ncbi:MAG: bifunctional phosphopantothenoylcysteine decarboxylase/phosphopantothenate--cysteine ligase CoaBC [Paludibacteraceae bacterium]|nr:bifunctional phosphopantothenoylcysteine decarboxylase/phosphopantothenate--cysteine ligase CoaBC [Paludibacteraceae bacterium]